MTVTQPAVNKAANVAWFMVNVAHLLLKPCRHDHPTCGILDLKAYARGHQYVCETVTWLPQTPEPMVMAQMLVQIAKLGSVHNAELALHLSSLAKVLTTALLSNSYESL